MTILQAILQAVEGGEAGPDLSLWVAVVALIGVVVTAVFTYLQNRSTVRSTERIAASKADDEALQLAKQFYESTINNLEKHIIWLQGSVDSLRERNTQLESLVKDLREEVETLKRQAIIVFRENSTPGS